MNKLSIVVAMASLCGFAGTELAPIDTSADRNPSPLKVDLNRISSVWVCIIVLREFAVTGIRLLASAQGVVMAAKMIGKIKTTTQMIAIIYLMFEPTILKIAGYSHDYANYPVNAITIIGDVLFFICVVMTIISGMDYLLKNLSYFKNAD